jgi:hypothetical protein
MKWILLAFLLNPGFLLLAPYPMPYAPCCMLFRYGLSAL